MRGRRPSRRLRNETPLRAAHEDLISQRADAVRRRDDQRANQLTAEIQAKAAELDRADTELRRLDEAWVEAGEILISRIDANRELLNDQLQPLNPQNEDRYRQLEEQFDSLTVLRDSVDAEIPRVPLEVPIMPNVRALPGDGDAERHRKANIYRDLRGCSARDGLKRWRSESANSNGSETSKRRRRNSTGAAQAWPEGFRWVRPGEEPCKPSATRQPICGRTAQRIEELEELRDELEQARAEAERWERELRPAGGGSG